LSCVLSLFELSLQHCVVSAGTLQDSATSTILRVHRISDLIMINGMSVMPKMRLIQSKLMIWVELSVLNILNKSPPSVILLFGDIHNQTLIISKPKRIKQHISLI